MFLLAELHRDRNDTWSWELNDEDGEMFIRSEQFFDTETLCRHDLTQSCHLLLPKIRYR